MARGAAHTLQSAPVDQAAVTYRPALSAAASSLATLILLHLATPAQAAPVCTFLTPIGASSTSPVVAKSVGPPGKAIGRTNWTTDFIVDQPYGSYKFFSTANFSDANAQYPVEGSMKFTDGSNPQVINQTMNPPIGTGRMFGPSPPFPAKRPAR